MPRERRLPSGEPWWLADRRCRSKVVGCCKRRRTRGKQTNRIVGIGLRRISINFQLNARGGRCTSIESQPTCRVVRKTWSTSGIWPSAIRANSIHLAEQDDLQVADTPSLTSNDPFGTVVHYPRAIKGIYTESVGRGGSPKSRILVTASRLMLPSGERIPTCR